MSTSRSSRRRPDERPETCGGIIGSPWARVFARAGHDVRVYARHEEVRATLIDRVRIAAERSHAVASDMSVDETVRRISMATDPAEALDGASCMQESLEGVDLNAPGGISDYLSRYGFTFDQMVRDRGGSSDVVTSELTAVLHAAMRDRLPLESLPDRIAWRDQRMADLRRLRRLQGPDSR